MSDVPPATHDSLRLAAIVEGSDDAIVSKNVDGIITSWNPAAERMFGYTSAEIVGRSIRVIIPPNRQAEEDMVLARIRRGERVEHFETERLRRDGELIHVSLTVSPIHDTDGTVIGASKIARDISERKRADQALTQARAAQADLQDRLAAIIDASGALLGSPHFEEVSAAIVNVARSVLPADAHALWRAVGGVWRIVAASGLSDRFRGATHPEESELELETRSLRVVNDVSEEWLAGRHDAYAIEGIRSLLAIPLEVSDELSASLVCYHRAPHHFTRVEVKSAEGLGRLASAVLTNALNYEAQRRSREQAAFIAEATSLLAGSLDHREALARLVERVAEEVADWCACYLVSERGELACVHAQAPPGTDPAALDRFVRQAAGSDDPFSVEQVVEGDAPVLVTDWMQDVQPQQPPERRRAAIALGVRSCIAVPLVAHGRSLGALVLGTSGRRPALASGDLPFVQELAYRIALSIDNSLSFEEARAANRLKDEFLANLSHELRTPLNAIAGYARMLRTGTLPEERRARAYEVLDNNAAALSQIVEDVLDISRIVTGKIRLQVGPVDLYEVVGRSVDTVRPAADAKGIRIEVPPGGVAVVAGDADRLQQVLWNLLSNAVKFTPARGSVTVRVDRVDDSWDVSVADTGVGIERQVLPYIFERFRQGDSRIAREHGGLGLGLAIARQIVELHGGTIAADSPGPGLGATLRVRLPALADVDTTRTDPKMLS